MDEEVDLVNRDQNELNSHVKVRFEDIFGEPEGVRSYDCVWRNSYGCFNCGKNCIYKLLTTVCGLCIALCWGCNFGCVACQHVWCSTPYLRDFIIGCTYTKKWYEACMNAYVVPLCEACGMCFSKIQVETLGK